MFGKTYELSLNKNYVSHWGLAEAIRELIQNAIDSESPFIYEFEKSDSGYTLHLNSEFTTLSPSTLLLGSTSKADATDKIGSFGEGYKIALLVLTRIGKDIDILNGDKLWKPKFAYNSKYGDDLLTIEESTLPSKNKGLTFKVHGLTTDEVESIKESCLRMQSHIGAIKQTKYGDILLEKPGMLYVGTLFVCKIELKYGYNIKPEYIRLERDRQTVDNWKLNYITTQMWIDTEDYDHLAELIDAETPDTEYVQYGSPEVVKEACYRLFQKRNPGGIVAKNQQEFEKLIDRGLTKVVHVGPSMYSQVSQSGFYQAENRVKKESVEERLQRFLKDNRSEMRTKAITNFKVILAESKQWRHS